MNWDLPLPGNEQPPADTTPEMHARFGAMLMARSNEERFIMGALMFDAARTMILASAPQDMTGLDLKRWLYRRIYDEEPPF